jgi:hypothetical protein
MAQVHGVPVLRLVLKRLGPAFCLVPWTSALDWLESEIKSWQMMRTKRCALDERIAMRDFVISMDAEIGVIVPGDCTSIDRAEVDLAVARVALGVVESYVSPRLKCYSSKDWLRVSDSEEWGPYPLTPIDAQKHLPQYDLEKRWARCARDSGSTGP